MPRPQIVVVRGLRLAKVPLLPFPKPDAMELLPEDAGRHFGTKLQGCLILDLPLVWLKPQVIQAYETELLRPVSTSQEFKPIEPSQMTGRCFPPLQSQQVIGPAPLQLSDLEAQGLERPMVGKAPVTADLVRPMLEPSVISSEIGYLALPKPLYDHQREALKELFKREALLLADEPGMGKTVTVSVALMALIQKGLARRCLVVCPETGFRHWTAHLLAWAPFSQCSVIRGERGQRVRAWQSKAHIYLTDYLNLATDIEAGILADSGLEFDVVALDGIHTIRFHSLQISSALKHLKARRRWALTGAVPGDIEDWVRIFSFLIPEKGQASTRDTLPDFRRRFQPYVLRRTKEQVAENLPTRIRQEVWLDLDQRQSVSYQQALSEERERLSRLGGAVARTHITAAIDRLKGICNFAPESYDSNKVRALVDLIEEVAAAEAKMIVFSQFHEEGLERLQSVLEAYGALRLNADTPMKRREQLLDAFRKEDQWHVLLVEMGARTDGVPFTQVTHIVHFDHSWNPAIRQRAERRIHPMLGPSTSVNIYEFWVADTIDENLHALLHTRALLPGQVPEGTRPLDLDKRITVEDWLYEVLEISPGTAPAELSLSPFEETQLPSSEALQRPDLRLGDHETNVETLMHLMGYTDVKALGEHDEGHEDYIVARLGEAEQDRALVRFLRTEKSVGVQEGRRLLEDMQARPDCQTAYLVVTADFTEACKRLARQSAGKLLLVSGSDWRRRLQDLGQV
jgi:superfamily II DNA or RNA helicase